MSRFASQLNALVMMASIVAGKTLGLIDTAPFYGVPVCIGFMGAAALAIPLPPIVPKMMIPTAA